jgi:hypothetical protein
MLRMECDCCRSIFAVSEKGQESALFQNTLEPRCPACHGYLLKKVPSEEDPVDCMTCTGLEEREDCEPGHYRCKIRDVGIDPYVKEPCSSYEWNGST